MIKALEKQEINYSNKVYALIDKHNRKLKVIPTTINPKDKEYLANLITNDFKQRLNNLAIPDYIKQLTNNLITARYRNYLRYEIY